ncbi:Uncharacterized conserved protein [Plasmopara halstedii]|uniref:Uncharacterized conserved protein n=1 Tax=Plasmopara halstedii TaxID=4781 RepID=A0A0P1ABZ0_PLAHL|nr:Uncharacterized conserved protein [Plasmopara halstedii]CEG37823.1 Uncharacterized conserved protein [Plasmopara halstedii]|eukprot:XP_024574192.1 Uncharacterized conserved protein [Plasmopara halstedii]
MSSPSICGPTRKSRRTPSPRNPKKKLQDVQELAQEISIVMTDEEENEEENIKITMNSTLVSEKRVYNDKEKTEDQENCANQEQENKDAESEKVAALEEKDKSVDESKIVAVETKELSVQDDTILLLDDGDNNEKDQDEEEDDEDINYYASLAASGLNLSIKSSGTSIPALTTKQSTIKVLKQQLVPNQLDSGASQYQTFFDFEGLKRSQVATLRADARAVEESKILAAGQKAVAHSQRQRIESQHKKSAGRRWFNFESEEMTDDARRDFALLRMRNYLDPKKFYKSSDHSRGLPKHFQMGTVIEGAHEYHSARLTKKQRRKTFTDEIMADEAVVQYTNRVAGNIQNARSKHGRKKRRMN